MLTTVRPNICRACLAQHCQLSSRFYSNHYSVLGVSRNATQKQIKDAYLDLCKREHPDQKKGQKSHEKFVKINEAYNVLSKESSRNEYDMKLGIVRGFPGSGAYGPNQEGGPRPGPYNGFPGQPFYRPGDFGQEERQSQYNPYANDPFVQNNAEYFRKRHHMFWHNDPFLNSKGDQEFVFRINSLFVRLFLIPVYIFILYAILYSFKTHWQQTYWQGHTHYDWLGMGVRKSRGNMDFFILLQLMTCILMIAFCWADETRNAEDPNQYPKWTIEKQREQRKFINYVFAICMAWVVLLFFLKMFIAKDVYQRRDLVAEKRRLRRIQLAFVYIGLCIGTLLIGGIRSALHSNKNSKNS